MVLRCLSDADAVIIGGQGVNVWSLVYEKPAAEPWRSSRPYTSVDADALADRAQMVKLARLLEAAGFNVRVQVPRAEEESVVNTGVVVATKSDLELSINLLQTVLGLSNQDIRTNAVNLVWEETAVRLLHPLLCVESKTQNLLRLPQDSPEAPRQDKKHLVLSIANLREHLLQRSTPPLAAQGLHIARRLVDFAYQEPGRNVLTRHQLDLLDGIPWPAWRANAVAELREFAGREPEFRKEIQERLEAEAEITRWIAELKARTK